MAAARSERMKEFSNDQNVKAKFVIANVNMLCMYACMYLFATIMSLNLNFNSYSISIAFSRFSKPML